MELSGVIFKRDNGDFADIYSKSEKTGLHLVADLRSPLLTLVKAQSFAGAAS